MSERLEKFHRFGHKSHAVLFFAKKAARQNLPHLESVRCNCMDSCIVENFWDFGLHHLKVLPQPPSTYNISRGEGGLQICLPQSLPLTDLKLSIEICHIAGVPKTYHLIENFFDPQVKFTLQFSKLNCQ